MQRAMSCPRAPIQICRSRAASFCAGVWRAKGARFGHYALVSDWVWMRHEFPWLGDGFVDAVNEQCAVSFEADLVRLAWGPIT
jgi:hypothetical protein